MNKTKINHINPQSLLRFWCDGKFLKGFYKPKCKIIDITTPKDVCYKQHFLPQNLEDEFAKNFDAKIGKSIKNIIASGIISDDDKLFLSKFQIKQILRNPFLDNIVGQTAQKFLGLSNRENNLNIMIRAFETTAPELINKHFNMHWQLLISKTPVFITNEAIDTPDCLDNKYGVKCIYFPITPKHCIVMSDLKIHIELDQNLIIWINNMIARSPHTDWIIFNKTYDPMKNIQLFKNNIQIYP